MCYRKKADKMANEAIFISFSEYIASLPEHERDVIKKTLAELTERYAEKKKPKND